MFSTAFLNDGLDRVREIIGDADNSGLSDAAIEKVLWNCHFDIDETVQWAIGASRGPRPSGST